MSQTITCARLESRGLLRVGGPDAAHFLQNIVTCEVDELAQGAAAFGALLTPQGKILFDFFLVREAENFLIDVDASKAEELARRLAFYRLRAKVEIAPAYPAIAVLGCWGGEPQRGGTCVRDPRLAAMGWRVYGGADEGAGAESLWHSHRIALGIPHGGIDYAFGDTFPHEALMDQFGGVDFAKGCYVGQEVVSRMQHRGTARSRVVMVEGDAPLPQPGTPVEAGGKAAGTMGGADGAAGLALLRLDRVRDALDAGEAATAAGVALTVSIQPWARFGWPGA